MHQHENQTICTNPINNSEHGNIPVFDKKVELEMWHIHTLNERVETRINEPYTSVNFIKITSNEQSQAKSA